MTNKVYVSKNQLITLVVGTIITSVITTAVALVRVANNDHFLLGATVVRVDSLESNIVPRSEFREFANGNNARLENIEVLLTQLLNK